MVRGNSTSICVCVPVRNERRRLPVLLRALARQQLQNPAFALCLFFDGCIDGSEALVQSMSGELPFPVLTTAYNGQREPNAGRARQRALALGLETLSDPNAGILLTTDADSAPALDWVAMARDALDPAEIVTGRLCRAGAKDPVQDSLEAYYDDLHAYRRWLDPTPWEATPSHHFSGGANMAFRSAAYVAVGGFQAVASGEDALIIDQAARTGLRVRRDPRVIVRTSARRTGRADGLASHLRRLSVNGATEIRVQHPADAAWQYQGHALARAAFESHRPDALMSLSARIQTPLKDLQRALGAAVNAEAFAMGVIPAAPCLRTVSLAEAAAALSELRASKALAA